MKKIALFILFSVIVFETYSACQIKCNVRYIYQRLIDDNVNVGTSSGSYIGTYDQYAPSGVVIGQDASRYENVWSNNYYGDVIFRSGYELNEALGNNYYNENAIIAEVKWSNGGYSIIIINDWFTKLKYVTEEEILYDTNSNRIEQMNGYDSKNRYWEFSM